MRFRNSRFFKVLTVFVLINFIAEIVVPVGVYALTSGPSQPEFSSFTPVSTTEMVNLFSGDFNYNIPVIEIPGVDGGGYAMSLSYNSGVTSEQEASWVGLGWTLNPGSINRSLRGFPDEYNNVNVKYYNKSRPNWTSMVGATAGIEAFSKDSNFGGNLSKTLRFNNYYGYTKNLGVGITAKGFGSINANFDNDGVTFSASINPIGLINKFRDDNILATQRLEEAKEKEDGTNNYESVAKQARTNKINSKVSGAASSLVNSNSYGVYSNSQSVRSTNFTKYFGKAFNWSANLQVNPVVPVGFEIGYQGGFNIQYNKYLTESPTFGFLHSNSATSDGVMDYYVEKGSAFDKRDVFIGMPFSNADQFVVTGEGVLGGFRAHHNEIGHFKPNEYESSIQISQLGSELMVGANVGVGVDIGFGSQKNRMRSWNTRGSFSGSNEAGFRFGQDQGGKIEYTSNQNVESARVNLISQIPGFRNANAIPPTAEGDSRSDNFELIDDENGQSSFISEEKDGDNIVGFSVVNSGGSNYSYSEPISVRNESNISVDVPKGSMISNRYLTFGELRLGKLGTTFEMKNLENNQGGHNHKTVVGEIRDEPYASGYLLTSITSPQYVDADNVAGPSNGDFGGWTNFEYQTKYGIGSPDGWYRYRTPYAGLLYNQNAISDTQDDLGSVSTGEKEVKYLKSVETKTHIAYFITNTTDLAAELNLQGEIADLPYLKGASVDDVDKERKDGMGAMDLNNDSDPAAVGGNAKGDTKLDYLDKILLFVKNPEGAVLWEKPLKIVRFEYDYSLVPNVPNNVSSSFDFTGSSNTTNTEDIGKLTLKKVWFEYNGTYPAKISPYKFEYNYPRSSDFLAGASYFAELERLPESVQNPLYSPYILGPWGKPAGNAVERKDAGTNWIDQGASLQDKYYEEVYDPAAWHLKQISLPSGGKINVQYEEKDYTKVQDRDAMVMASLEDIGERESSVSYNGDNPLYGIKLADLGIDSSDKEAILSLKNKIENHFLETEEKIYFKFLYALKGLNPSIDDCRSEYISGYATFGGVSLDDDENPTQLFIRLENSGGSSGSRGSIPRQACYELVSNQKQGKLDNSDCIERDYERKYNDAITKKADGGQNGNSFSGIGTLGLGIMIDMSVDGKLIYYPLDQKQEVCLAIDYEKSFLKLPMSVAKKASGARVKRLLFYDQGLETGDPSLYGTEYLYVKEDGVTSSGVATNEPTISREENPLVTFIARGEQGFLSRITAGEDKEQAEGPLGESILPSASIGHSRVVVKNIHSGISGDGFTVNEFHTANEFPYDGIYPGIESDDKNGVSKSGLDTKRDFLKIPALFFNYNTSKTFTAQGFRFLMNSMHGQQKSVTNYAGIYDTGIQNAYVVSQQQYDYYKPGEKIKMMRWNSTTDQIEEYLDLPGTEMEMAFESKKVTDKTIDFSVEIDLSATICFLPPIFVTIWPTFSMDDNVIATHATTKVISYPAINKSVTTFQDGIYHTQENIAFNGHTGKPILTRNADGYDKLKLAGNTEAHDGSIYQLSVPASWMYEAMGPKSSDILNTNQLGDITGTFTSYGVEPTGDWFNNPTNLLSASVQTFSDNWFSNASNSEWPNERIVSEYDLSSDDQEDLNKIWRPKSSFVYKSDELSTSDAKSKVYSSGTFEMDMDSQFDWFRDYNNQDQTDPNWINSSRILLYSPNGEPLEERDVLNIHSAALFKPSNIHHLPSMVTANAEYDNIYFEDFEYSEESLNRSHSGTRSKQISQDETLVSGLKVNEHLIRDGGVFMGWFYFGDNTVPADLVLDNGITQATLEKVAQTGEWVLMSANIIGSDLGNIDDEITINLSTSGSFPAEVYVDDVRFQPFDSEGNCYVYDVESLRLLAEFDDQHFGIYYQYNDKGQLVSRSIETERGLKTVTETQYNLPKEFRTGSE